LRTAKRYRAFRSVGCGRHDAGTLRERSPRILGRRQRLLSPGEKAAERLATRWSNLILVYLPIHASWLNQVEIYFSIRQRKVLTPNDFDSLFTLEDRILAFQERYQENARPFQWRFTREDLSDLLAKLALQETA
jgi:hypothetical protein